MEKEYSGKNKLGRVRGWVVEKSTVAKFTATSKAETT